MAYFIELLISGALTGLMYSLVALGFVLIYKSAGVPNLAQGALVMTAGYAVWMVMAWGLSVWIAIPIAAAIMFGFGLVVAAITYLSIVIGELAPKRLALRSPEGIACAVARPMAMLSRAMGPVVWLLDASTGAVFRLLGLRDAPASAVTAFITPAPHSTPAAPPRATAPAVPGRRSVPRPPLRSAVVSPRTAIRRRPRSRHPRGGGRGRRRGAGRSWPARARRTGRPRRPAR